RIEYSMIFSIMLHIPWCPRPVRRTSSPACPRRHPLLAGTSKAACPTVISRPQGCLFLARHRFRLQFLRFGHDLIWVGEGFLLTALAAQEDRLAVKHHLERLSHHSQAG